MALILSGDTGVPVTTVTGTLPVANGGTGVATSTGSGANVLGTSPTLTTPTFDSASLATISGTAPLYMCRAWVNFNGTGTVAINASGNVSSITDNGTGDYTVNFTTAMVDANYCAQLLGVGRETSSGTTQASGLHSTDNINATTYTTSAVRVAMNKLGSLTGFNDCNPVLVAIFR
jgi:hypothetical protein